MFFYHLIWLYLWFVVYRYGWRWVPAIEVWIVYPSRWGYGKILSHVKVLSLSKTMQSAKFSLRNFCFKALAVSVIGA